LYVEAEAGKAIDWYWAHKGWKSWPSRIIRFSAILLTALAGIFPVTVTLFDIQRASANSGLWSSLLVGLAAALLGLDKAFGFSTGWARYVLAATSIRKTLEEFRMDWMVLSAQLTAGPKPEEIAKLLQRAKEFRAAVEGAVLQETKDWITEFQNNFAELEKDIKVQLDSLKEQAEKAASAHVAATEPGAIQLTVPNADQADGAAFNVSLESAAGLIAAEKVSNSRSWVRINVAPGQYRLTVSAQMNGKPSVAPAVVVVKPRETAAAEITLP
jgi:hypothetical protein